MLFLNIVLAFIMFGVALNMNLATFKVIFLKPRPVIAGILSQIIIMPAATFLLVMILKPTPSVALGMILVASCPGGNISNFFTTLAKGNIALGVSLTAFSTIFAVFTTPFNFVFWGSLYSSASSMVIPINIDLWELFKTVFLILGLPLVIGIWFAKKYPDITMKINKPIKLISILFFLGFIILAFSLNFAYFLNYIGIVALFVFLQNALALLVGYFTGKGLSLARNDCRTLSIETGIHNSGLGLALIFNPKLYNGLGGMAFIAGWWGIWHIVTGLIIALYWSKKDKLRSA